MESGFFFSVSFGFGSLGVSLFYSETSICVSSICRLCVFFLFSFFSLILQFKSILDAFGFITHSYSTHQSNVAHISEFIIFMRHTACDSDAHIFRYSFASQNSCVIVPQKLSVSTAASNTRINWLNVSCRLPSAVLVPTVGFHSECVFVCDWAYKYRNYNTIHARNWIDVRNRLLCDPYQLVAYDLRSRSSLCDIKNAQSDRLVCFRFNSHAETKRNK